MIEKILRQYRTIIIGERYNGKRWTPTICKGDYMAFKIRRQLGAFRIGQARSRLLSVGLSWGDAINLLFPSPILGEWDEEEAGRIANIIQSSVNKFELVILLGKKVTEAFGYEYKPLTKFDNFIILPHPSGRNRTWNKEKIKEFLIENFKTKS